MCDEEGFERGVLEFINRIIVEKNPNEDYVVQKVGKLSGLLMLSKKQT